MAGFIFKITNVHVYVYAHTIWWIKRCIWIDKNICLRWQDYGGILYFFSLSLPPLEILQNTWGFHNNLTDVYVSSQFITKSSGWRWQCRSDPWTVFCLYRSEVLSAKRGRRSQAQCLGGAGRGKCEVWGGECVWIYLVAHWSFCWTNAQEIQPSHSQYRPLSQAVLFFGFV